MRHHGKEVGQRVAQRRLRVGDARVDRLQRVLAREPPFPLLRIGLAEPEVGADEAHEIDRVAGVEHGEARPEANRLGVLLQQPMSNGVECATPHAAGGVGVGVTGGAPDEFVRRPSTEREQQQASGVGAVIDKAGEPRGKRGGLARAGAGDDQQRRPVVFDRYPLRFVQNEHAFAC